MRIVKMKKYQGKRNIIVIEKMMKSLKTKKERREQRKKLRKVKRTYLILKKKAIMTVL